VSAATRREIGGYYLLSPPCSAHVQLARWSQHAGSGNFAPIHYVRIFIDSNGKPTSHSQLSLVLEDVTKYVSGDPEHDETCADIDRMSRKSNTDAAAIRRGLHHFFSGIMGRMRILHMFIAADTVVGVVVAGLLVLQDTKSRQRATGQLPRPIRETVIGLYSNDDPGLCYGIFIADKSHRCPYADRPNLCRNQHHFDEIAKSKALVHRDDVRLLLAGPTRPPSHGYALRLTCADCKTCGLSREQVASSDRRWGSRLTMQTAISDCAQPV
jgi:hypothetical protein